LRVIVVGFMTVAAAGLALIHGSMSDAINLMVPRDGYRVYADLAYGADPRQKLDLYVPDGLKAPLPVLVFFYGGSWQSGEKSSYLALGQAFASQGIIVAVADYRLYPKVKYPAFIEDAAQTVRYVHDHVKTYGGDAQRLFVSGHSAGAYLAVMLGSDEKYLRNAGGDFAWLRGVIGISGPYDFLPLTGADFIDMFGGSGRDETQPINHIDGVRPPMFLVTGDDDQTVSPGNTQRMAARLAAAGSPVQTKIYPGVTHVGIIMSLAPGFGSTAPLRDDVVAFIRGHAA
jgi:acetyl esterase/lipase